MNRTALISIILFFSVRLQAQVAPHTYWIQFTNKDHNTYSLSRPLDFLSQRSLDRRTRQGLTLSESDLPVSRPYLDSLRKIGGKVLFTSRWQNTATVYSADTNFLSNAFKISIVKAGIKVYKTDIKVHAMAQTMLSALDTYNSDDYGASFGQIHIHNGELMHNSGFRGQNMVIGILDAGFYNVDKLSAFKAMRDRKGILGVHDFLRGDDSVFNKDTHGMIVLSVICGNIRGKLIGTAPEADFYLFRTENAATEYEVEEATWVAGMERADSVGADVINSSLGYTTFDDPKMNHSYTDMDGHTTIISKEASLAASKGIILANSAGNLGTRAFHYVSAPADAENILTVGAIGKDRKLANYTSRGPTYDGRIKPDVSAIGYQTISATTVDGEVAGVNGTSLSSPVIAGLVTCLWQEFPHKSSYEIIDAVKRSSDRYANPNDSFGYGIPDFSIARQILRIDDKATDFMGDIYPNPFQDNFTLNFYTAHAQQAEIFLVNMIGQVVWTKKVQTQEKNFTKVNVNDMPHASGIYLICIKTKDVSLVAKLVKQ
jgi:serine protease AprX